MLAGAVDGTHRSGHSLATSAGTGQEGLLTAHLRIPDSLFQWQSQNWNPCFCHRQEGSCSILGVHCSSLKTASWDGTGYLIFGHKLLGDKFVIVFSPDPAAFGMSFLLWGIVSWPSSKLVLQRRLLQSTGLLPSSVRKLPFTLVLTLIRG